MKYWMGIAVICIMGVGMLNAELINDEKQPQKTVRILLGSTRQGRRSEKIAKAVYDVISKNQKAKVEFLDLKELALPLFDDPVPPFQRKTEPSVDPIVNKWSETIKATDALIILVPDYNQGYSAVLKNAIDLLFYEWSGKRIAFVGYGDAGNGGTSAVAQLREVLSAIGANLLVDQLLIPTVYQALTEEGKFINKEYEVLLGKMVDQLTG